MSIDRDKLVGHINDIAESSMVGMFTAKEHLKALAKSINSGDFDCEAVESDNCDIETRDVKFNSTEDDDSNNEFLDIWQ